MICVETSALSTARGGTLSDYRRLRRVLINAGIGRMSALRANRTRRNDGNDVNDPLPVR